MTYLLYPLSVTHIAFFLVPMPPLPFPLILFGSTMTAMDIVVGKSLLLAHLL
jgi:hypothetical protein